MSKFRGQNLNKNWMKMDQKLTKYLMKITRKLVEN